MAALAADLNISAIGPIVEAPFSVNGADVFYQGAVVFIDTGGGVQVVPATGDRAVGIMTKQVTTTASAEIISVAIMGTFWMPVGTNIAAADEGDVLVLDISATQSDNVADFVSATDITAATTDIILGQILRVTSTQMLVHISPAITGRIYASTATNAWI